MCIRDSLKSILIIRAGPIVIGQAREFASSGAQACKALREEGYRVIPVNSTPATIMPHPEMADVTYIEPITWRVVEKIISRAVSYTHLDVYKRQLVSSMVPLSGG